MRTLTAVGFVFAAGCASRGPATPSPASVQGLVAEARRLEDQGKHAEAVTLAQKAVDAARSGPETSPRTLEEALDVLGMAEYARGQYAPALAAMTEELPLAMAHHGEQSREVLHVLTNLGKTSINARETDAAREHLARAARLAERLQNDEVLAEVLYSSATIEIENGKDNKAFEMATRAATIARRLRDPTTEGDSLQIISLVASGRGDRVAAEDALRRALALHREGAGSSSPKVAVDEQWLAALTRRAGRLDEALRHYDDARAIYEANWKPNDPRYAAVAGLLEVMAAVYHDLADIEHELPLLKRALDIYQRLQGDGSPRVATAKLMLSMAYLVAGDEANASRLLAEVVANAEHVKTDPALLQMALEMRTNRLMQGSVEDRKEALGIVEGIVAETRRNGSPDHLARGLRRKGMVCATLDDREGLMSAFEEACEITAQAFGAESIETAEVHEAWANAWYGMNETAKAADEFARALDLLLKPERESLPRADSRTMLAGYFDALWSASRTSVEADRKARERGFVAAQFLADSRAAVAFTQMAARADADGALADLVRREQDLAAQHASARGALTQTLSAPEGENRTKVIASLQVKVDGLEREHAAVGADLKRRFPAYQAFVSPPNLEARIAQGLLHDGEALVTFHVGRAGCFVWVLTRAAATWRKVDLTQAQLAAEVKALREGLVSNNDPRGLARALSPDAAPPTFDRARAYRLHEMLLGPVKGSLRGVKHLFVVTSGALQSLPLGVLVTRDPAGSAPTFDSYRDTAWLAREQAITVLPSVSSLVSVRARKGAHAGKAFVGIGDPILNDDLTKAGLGPLRLTGDELRRIADSLGASDADVHLGREATEDAVKAMKLRDYRVIHFATHGLTAHLLPQVTEPALVLTSPMTGDHEDGFLTASEVANLDLDADWVVLSACNSAAGDGSPRDQALSGLARAFFYAGARAVLASHWSVSSQAATALTVRIFTALKADASLGRAEALRRAMVAVMNEPGHSDPAYWGPFSYVGGGEAARD